MDHNEAVEITKVWEADVASRPGQSFPFDAVMRALDALPEAGVWAVSQDARALFALLPGDVLFILALRGEGRVLITRRPLHGERIIVSLELGEGTPTETGGVRCETDWTFWFDPPHSGGESQRISGTVTSDQMGPRPRLDAREEFARAIAARAGWSEFDPPAGN